VRSGKEAQRVSQERRNEGEGRSKKDKEDGKSEGIILERSGLKKKEEEFWDCVREFEIVGLVETWVEDKSWEEIEKLLPKKYKWECQGTT
jgi:hypothetical protein